MAGDYLALPTISHLRLIDVPRDSQGLAGTVTVAATLGDPTAVGLGRLTATGGRSSWPYMILAAAAALALLGWLKRGRPTSTE